MLFLAPEGVIVDHGELADMYIKQCNDFCAQQGFKPFDYVLTPRYKGLTAITRLIKEEGRILTVLMCFTTQGKLLNERLSSKERNVPDLYSFFNGALLDPVNVYIHIKVMPTLDVSPADVKRIMMEDYANKDRLVRYFHENGTFPDCKMGHYEAPHKMLNAVTLAHNAVLIMFASAVWSVSSFLWFFVYSAVFVGVTCNIGRIMSSGSTMESIPFETAIKSVMMAIYARKMKKQLSKQSSKDALGKTAKTAY